MLDQFHTEEENMKVNALDSQIEQLEAHFDALLPYSPVITGLILIYTVYKIVQYARLKNEFDQLQVQMERVLLREQAVLRQEAEKAELNAQFVKTDGKHTKLQIVNLNKPLATNVRIAFPEGNHLIIQKEIDAKFPLASLNMHKPIELSIAVYNNAPRKIILQLIWDDGFQINNAKTIEASY